MNSHHSLRSQAAALLETTGRDGGSTLDQLVPLLYDDLREMAHRELARVACAHTLQTTALVHEAYLKLVDATRVTRRGRAYFFAAAAGAMRQILVDHARRRNAAKRGGGAELVTLGEEDASVTAYAAELLDLHDALLRLAERSPRQARVVEYRFFAGMSVQETAEVLGVSSRTVELDWAVARAWLYRALGETFGSPPAGVRP